MAFILLSRKAYIHNLDIIAQKVGSVSKIAVVLKDNAYGHGLIEMAELAHEYGVKDAVVHNVAEAQEIKYYFERILILGGHEYAVDEKMYFAVNSLSQIAKMPQGCRVELKVDTGMHRNGVAMDEVEKALAQISENGLVLKGVFTHNRSADTLSTEWFWQRKNFEKVKLQVRAMQEKLDLETPRFHSANSASAFRFKVFDEDLVRVGIAAYGCLEMAPTLEQPDLKPVLVLKAKKIASRRIRKGEHIGYNATFRAESEMTVSTYDVGYADGLHRAASNNYETPEGEKLLGRISMDNSSYTGKRDELLIFDDANRYAKASGTIGYEILAGLHPKIKREVI
jgi:alanine racemase